MGQKSCIEENKKTQFMPCMNWSQNIGSALILSLSTISVILQPLLSKFSFLINLVSRNGSFFPSFLDKCSCFLVEFLMIIAIIAIVFCSHCLSYKKTFTSSLSAFLQRWLNGFHQLTTCLDHNVASLWQRYPVLSSHFLLLWVTLILII